MRRRLHIGLTLGRWYGLLPTGRCWRRYLGRRLPGGVEVFWLGLKLGVEVG